MGSNEEGMLGQPIAIRRQKVVEAHTRVCVVINLRAILKKNLKRR